MSELRDWTKLDTRWYEDPDLLACADEVESCFTLWPVLVAKAKADSHATANPDGTITIAPRRLSFDARCSIDSIGPALQVMADHDLLTFSAEGTKEVRITLSGFAKWQAPRKSAAERQARYREKKAAISRESDGVSRSRDGVSQEVTRREEKREENRDTSTSATPSVDRSDIREVFDYWVEATGRPASRTRLTTARKQKIAARIREGYTVDQIREAITGYAGSRFHRGENDNGTRYDTLDLICRSGDKIERGIEMTVGNSPTVIDHDRAAAEAEAKYQAEREATRAAVAAHNAAKSGAA